MTSNAVTNFAQNDVTNVAMMNVIVTKVVELFCYPFGGGGESPKLLISGLQNIYNFILFRTIQALSSECHSVNIYPKFILPRKSVMNLSKLVFTEISQNIVV